MGVATLRRTRSFYQTFPHGSAIPAELGGDEIRSTELIESGSGFAEIRSTASIESPTSGPARFPALLGWSHYLVLLRVQNPQARSFYEIEAARESWSVRELERQVAALLFERLSMNKTPEQVLALARQGQEVSVPSDVLKDPFVLEFADLRENPTAHERDLEQAIIDRLEDFLLEMGKGFCFVARQKRMTLEGDHFYVDLVFYNRLLRCFVLVDLKLGKLTHQDLGQMQMYVNFFDRFQRAWRGAPILAYAGSSRARPTA
jgi:predicted nuclease of restriction endonuclease-like (RecB) superfamily